ncbi:MAG: Tol-Pal system beta propeller repeat protein TolB [Gammaproteobacteria bacterium]|nr:Tol-Pal system beta propeller repeat protein TolB [Gammaproteobacteria bacterium]
MIALLLALAPLRAFAALDIVITEGVKGASPIAVIPFAWAGAGKGAPQELATIISSNLGRSGRFAPLAEKNMPSLPSDPAQIRWEDWRRIGIYNLVIGKLTPAAQGRYDVEFRLFDTQKMERIAGLRDTVLAGDLRRTGHQISDIIYETLTGERGAFDTQIAYVTERAVGKKERRFVLNVADSDGYNAFQVLESPHPIMSPAWAPNARDLAYVSFENNRPRIFVQDLIKGLRREVAAYPGINGAPAWSPDGTRLAMTLSKDGNAEIYVLHLKTGVLNRITNNASIDTEPTWSPDGQDLVFTSDRGGKPQLYRVAARGGSAQRLTFDGAYNSRAVFDPDGSQIAFVQGVKGKYQIAVLDFASGEVRTLTKSRLDESPTFSPNGQMILYAATDSGGSTLAAVSVDGRVRQRIAVERGRLRDPAWSPFASP